MQTDAKGMNKCNSMNARAINSTYYIHIYYEF